jgi:hypothetical protein
MTSSVELVVFHKKKLGNDGLVGDRSLIMRSRRQVRTTQWFTVLAKRTN